MDTITIYTDGSCLGNPGPGGWAAVLIHPIKRKELSGGFAETTNNRMELRAVIEALKELTKPWSVTIVTDSQYVKNAFTKKWLANWKKNGWKTAARKPVKNQDLWRALDEQVQRHQVEWRWVKGHAGTPDNERCDELARGEASKPGLPKDIELT